MVSLLQEHGATALKKLSKLLKVFPDSGMGKMIPALAAQEKIGADTFTISGEKVMAAFLRRDNQSMNDVIAVYDDMLKLYKSIKPPKSSWPIICIDEANVLTQWQYGGLKKRETLSTLLRFFVKVRQNNFGLATLVLQLWSQASSCSQNEAFFWKCLLIGMPLELAGNKAGQLCTCNPSNL